MATFVTENGERIVVADGQHIYYRRLASGNEELLVLDDPPTSFVHLLALSEKEIARLKAEEARLAEELASATSTGNFLADWVILLQGKLGDAHWRLDAAARENQRLAAALIRMQDTLREKEELVTNQNLAIRGGIARIEDLEAENHRLKGDVKQLGWDLRVSNTTKESLERELGTERRAVQYYTLEHKRSAAERNALAAFIRNSGYLLTWSEGKTYDGGRKPVITRLGPGPVRRAATAASVYVLRAMGEFLAMLLVLLAIFMIVFALTSMPWNTWANSAQTFIEEIQSGIMTTWDGDPFQTAEPANTPPPAMANETDWPTMEIATPTPEPTPAIANAATSYDPIQLAQLTLEDLPRGARLYYSRINTLSRTRDAKNDPAAITWQSSDSVRVVVHNGTPCQFGSQTYEPRIGQAYYVIRWTPGAALLLTTDGECAPMNEAEIQR